MYLHIAFMGTGGVINAYGLLLMSFTKLSLTQKLQVGNENRTHYSVMRFNQTSSLNFILLLSIFPCS